MTENGQRATERRSTRAVVVCLAAIATLIALDLWSKQWALDVLSSERPGSAPPVCEPNELGHVLYQRVREEAVELVPGYLELRYAENCGAAFGLMREAPGLVRRVVFGVAAVLASAALLWMFWRGRGGPMFAWSVPFIVSGAIGNLVDRARLGYVVDFIRFHVHDSWEWPTFNVADAAITVGVVLLLLDGLREGRRDEAASPEKQPEG
ncbi:MAG: signal peptidase II [Myxococcota bacterium]